MEKRALIIGIDSYDNFHDLKGCVADATELCELLRQNGDGSPNYECHLLTSPGSQPVNRSTFRRAWQELFDDFSGDVVFYFSGHGTPNEIGGYLCLEDSTSDDPGFGINDLLRVVNHSMAREVLLIIDTCFGFFPGRSPRFRDAIIENPIQLREGVTLLGAARPTGKAKEDNGRGVFTRLFTEALAGGAADVRGYVTAASSYAYVEQSLGAWEQRPIFRSNVSSFLPIRRCTPSVSDIALKELVVIFQKPDSRFHLNPSFSSTHKSATRKNVQIFKKFEVYQNARLLKTVKEVSLSAAALNSNYVELTPIGKFYWHLVKSKRF